MLGDKARQKPGGVRIFSRESASVIPQIVKIL